jgi:dimethylargininase
LRIAITREVSPAMQDYELSYLPRTEIDMTLAHAQHRAYEQALAALGCRVQSLPALPGCADSVFVEDTAVVLDEVAMITRPGAESRRAETAAMAEVLKPYRELRYIEDPGTLDGGDVLHIGDTLYVGLSARSSAAGIEQLRAAVVPFGYRVEAVTLQGCLHLKTAATLAAPELLLLNPAWVDGLQFQGVESLSVDPREPHGANVVLLDGGVIYPASCPRTRERLERRGIRVTAVDMSETEKAEGGVTCCSLVFKT